MPKWSTSAAVPDFSTGEFFDTVVSLIDNHTTTGTSYLIALTALTLGLKVEFFRSQKRAGKTVPGFPKTVDEPRLYRISGAKRGFLFWGASSERLMQRSYARESKDKSRTKALLHHAGVATPFGGIAQASNTAILSQFAAAGVTRVVVKPVSGSRSRDVLANVSLQHAHAHIAINAGTVSWSSNSSPAARCGS